jgi:hypothetical protein
VVDTLRPYLIVNSGALPGAFYFLPQGGSTTDLATTWNGDASFYNSTTMYRYAVDDTATFTAWDTLTSATLTGLTAGAHTFYLQAKDLSGNITELETEVGIGPLVGDRGILLVNGVDWGTYAVKWTLCIPLMPDGEPEPTLTIGTCLDFQVHILPFLIL